jgi:hypothetical protein
MIKIEQVHQERIDQLRIVGICRNMGYEVTTTEAYSIWRNYSDSPAISAGWLSLPAADSEIWEAIEEIILDMLDND